MTTRRRKLLLAVFALGALLLLAGVYVIVRVIDGRWSDWVLPAILVAIYAIVFGKIFMYYSLLSKRVSAKKEVTANG